MRRERSFLSSVLRFCGGTTTNHHHIFRMV